MKVEKIKNGETFKTRIASTRSIVSVTHIARIHIKESEYNDVKDLIEVLFYLDKNIGIGLNESYNALDSVYNFNPKYVDVYTDGERKFFMYNKYIIKIKEN